MMTKRKLLHSLLIASLLMPTVAGAQSDNSLPDIGTAAASELSIGQEIEMGDYYVRMLRRQAPLINDPLLNDYLNRLGHNLVKHADSVQTPFHFFLMRSDVLNAFAFFGGNVVVHSKLVLDTDNESQLASVLSHEISHVTQRHLARLLEMQHQNSPYLWGAVLGSILLSLANPQAGMAAITSTAAGQAQSNISFTQTNEQEADRIGLKLLQRAGYDPQASLQFLQKLADQSRFMSKPPEMLLTHPLPDSRLSDLRSRVQQYPSVHKAPSLDYALFKARLALVTQQETAISQQLYAYRKQNSSLAKTVLAYMQAYQKFENNQYAAAKNQLQSLLQADPNNVWFIDLMTDIDLQMNQSKAAIARLQAALAKQPANRVLQINLANTYLQANQTTAAASLLHRYTHQHADDPLGWELLAELYAKQQKRPEAMLAQAELLALNAQFQQAVTILKNAQQFVHNQPDLSARLAARAQQLQQLEQRYKKYHK